MNFYMPKWVEMLELGAPMKQSMVQNARKFLKDITYIKDLMNYPFEIEGDYIEQVKLEKNGSGGRRRKPKNGRRGQILL